MSPRVLVAGVGNIFLGDDGFGCAVVRELADRSIPDGVRVHDFGIAGLHLAYEIADGVELLVLVDAVPHGEAGEVRVIEAAIDQVPTSTVDAHGMDPATVLASVRNLGVEPPRTLLVGCAPARLDETIGLSPLVAAAVRPAADAVLDLLARELQL